MKKYMKKCGALVCRALLSIISSADGNLNYVKIGLLIGTFALYALLLSWKFSFLLMLAIGWHESGHVWAMKRVGVATRGFYFIPFLGGVAISDTGYTTSRDKVIVAIMGPLWGMLLALVTWIAYLITDNSFLGVAAYWQAMFNLFNLLPANPLDGGQIFRTLLTSLNKKVADAFSIVSVFAFLAMFVIWHSPVFVFVAYLAGRDFWMHYKNPLLSDIPKLNRSEMSVTVGSYILLCGILGLIMILTGPVGASLLAVMFNK